MMSRKSAKEKLSILLGVRERLISLSFPDLKEKGTLTINMENTHLPIVIKVMLLLAIQSSMPSLSPVSLGTGPIFPEASLSGGGASISAGP